VQVEALRPSGAPRYRVHRARWSGSLDVSGFASQRSSPRA